MKLYHGTNIDFTDINLSVCRPNKDFGQGFYLTEIKRQALLMAIRRDVPSSKKGHRLSKRMISMKHFCLPCH